MAYIRVQVKDTGHTISIPEELYDSAVYKKADGDALDHRGLPAEPEFKTSATKAASSSQPKEKD